MSEVVIHIDPHGDLPILCSYKGGPILPGHPAYNLVAWLAPEMIEQTETVCMYAPYMPSSAVS